MRGALGCPCTLASRRHLPKDASKYPSTGAPHFSTISLPTKTTFPQYTAPLSIDGLTLDENRYRFGINSSLLNHLLANLRLALVMGIPVEINTVLTDINTARLKPFLDELLRLRSQHNTPLVCVPRAVRVKRTLALSPDRIEAFVYFVRNQLGYQLYEAVRRTKFELSQRSEAVFEFECGPMRIHETVTRAAFEEWIRPELTAIRRSVDDVLASAGVVAAAVDRVFLTGGSSLVPAVRRLFVERFGSAKIAGGDELTSVARGLALRAASEEISR